MLLLIFYMFLAMLFIIAIIVVPHLTISALNILFNTNIGHSTEEWVSMLWLLVVISAAASSKTIIKK